MRHLCESGLRENCTSRLSGGRRPAPTGASSDPTPPARHAIYARAVFATLPLIVHRSLSRWDVARVPARRLLGASPTAERRRLATRPVSLAAPPTPRQCTNWSTASRRRLTPGRPSTRRDAFRRGPTPPQLGRSGPEGIPGMQRNADIASPTRIHRFRCTTAPRFGYGAPAYRGVRRYVGDRSTVTFTIALGLIRRDESTGSQSRKRANNQWVYGLLDHGIDYERPRI